MLTVFVATFVISRWLFTGMSLGYLIKRKVSGQLRRYPHRWGEGLRLPGRAMRKSAWLVKHSASKSGSSDLSVGRQGLRHGHYYPDGASLSALQTRFSFPCIITVCNQ